MPLCEMFYRDIVPPSAWKTLLDKLDKSGRMAQAFPFNPDITLVEFKNLLYKISSQAWLLAYDSEIAGVIYLNMVEGSKVRGHFAFAPTAALRHPAGCAVPVALGRMVAAEVLYKVYPDGRYVYDTVIGIVAAGNRAAAKYMQAIGGVITATIPGMCPIKNQGNAPGVIAYATRDTVMESWRKEYI